MFKQIVVFTIVFALFFAGCVSSPSQVQSQEGAAASAAATPGQTTSTPTLEATATPTLNATPTPAVEQQEQPSQGEESTETQETVQHGGTTLLMLGRSVSEGWAEYMGLEWQGNDGTYLGDYEGISIRYFHLDVPPRIVDTAKTALDAYDSQIVFFKFCFEDFGANEGEGVREKEEYIQQVYDEVVSKRHRKLIIGNALPQVELYGTDGLKSNHRAYNEWLEQFASTHANVRVLDLYDLLVDSNGNLKPEYAASPEDSHVNNAAYERITPELMRAVREMLG